jgi:sterol desaturase/sphingolipid hydroxylase (fatty acid hydroxylase superfamily)
MSRFPRSLDPVFAAAFADGEPRGRGSGWPSGVVAVLAGVLALGGVLCLRFPATLTAPGLRAIYPLGAVRVALAALMVVAAALGASNLALRRRKVLGLTALGLVSAALGMGGPLLPLPPHIDRGLGLGLDWFLLDVLFMTALFVPLERLVPHRRRQPVFRPGWTTDAYYVLVGHLAIQSVNALVVLPGLLLRCYLFGPFVPPLMARLPVWVQFPLIVVVADIVYYWVHRAAHQIPWLWRLHRLHHSSRAMDWLAGERQHLAEIVIVRTAVLVPLLMLGFAQGPLLAYVTFAGIHAIFIHANFGARLGWLEPFLVTPRVHHLHHASDDDAIDTNFAIHLPILDRLFGTAFAPPGRWPRRYGVVDFVAPEGFYAQQASVFARAPDRSDLAG